MSLSKDYELLMLKMISEVIDDDEVARGRWRTDDKVYFPVFLGNPVETGTAKRNPGLVSGQTPFWEYRRDGPGSRSG